MHLEAPESTNASNRLVGGECFAWFDICTGSNAHQSNPPLLSG